MRPRTARLAGAGTLLGALLAVVASVPSSWYGTPETDAHLFTPAVLSPLWIERTLVPWVTVVAIALLAAGVAALAVRDWSAGGRLRRWGGATAAAGVGALAVTAVAFALTGSSAGADAAGLLLALLGILIGGLGLVLTVAGLVAAGVGQVRASRPVVGYAMVGGQVLALLVAGASVLADLPGTVGALPVAIPFLASFAGVGWELWTHPEPVAAPDDDDTDDGHDGAGDDDIAPTAPSGEDILGEGEEETVGAGSAAAWGDGNDGE